MKGQTTFLEPHPSTTGRNTRGGAYVIGAGRGGAGNYARYASGSITDASTNIPRPALIEAAPRKQREGYVMSGIGGAGNAKKASSVQRYDFEAELDRVQKQTERTGPRDEVVLVGRGGAGNRVRAKPRQDSGSSISSSSSSGSTSRRISDAIDRVRKSMGRE